MTITSVPVERAALIELIWGDPGFPSTSEPKVEAVHSSDADWSTATNDLGLGNFSAFDHLDRLTFALPGSQTSVAYHIAAKGSSQRLVILHQGHACGFSSPGTGLQSFIRLLLTNGYSVAALYMPRPSACKDNRMVPYHQDLFKKYNGAFPGSPLQLFLDPVAQTVNYALNKWHYNRVDMVGLSGGGWTTTVYAAVDPRIKLSIPTAGTRPRSLPACGLNFDDPEQNAIPSYYNLYVLGSVGDGRRQIQILNKYDSCCFQVMCGHENLEPDIRTYEKAIIDVDKNLGGGTFSVFIDNDSHAHQISPAAAQQVILHALQAQ